MTRNTIDLNIKTWRNYYRVFICIDQDESFHIRLYSGCKHHRSTKRTFGEYNGKRDEYNRIKHLIDSDEPFTPSKKYLVQMPQYVNQIMKSYYEHIEIPNLQEALEISHPHYLYRYLINMITEYISFY